MLHSSRKDKVVGGLSDWGLRVLCKTQQKQHIESNAKQRFGISQSSIASLFPQSYSICATDYYRELGTALLILAGFMVT